MSRARRDVDAHPFSLRLVYPLVRALVLVLFRRFGARYRREGVEQVPRTGGLLIFPNHLSNCDPLATQLASPRLIHFMARREIFDMPQYGWMLRWFRAFPVTQSSADLGAIKNAIALANAGHAVCIYPEGQLSPDGELLPLFPGIAMVARKAGVPCICLGIRGTEDIMPSPMQAPRYQKTVIRCVWGEPRQFASDASQEEVMTWVESELRRLSARK